MDKGPRSGLLSFFSHGRVVMPHIPSVNPLWTKHCNTLTTRKSITPSIRLQRNIEHSWNYIMWNIMKNSCFGIKEDWCFKAFAHTPPDIRRPSCPQRPRHQKTIMSPHALKGQKLLAQGRHWKRYPILSCIACFWTLILVQEAFHLLKVEYFFGQEYSPK